MSEGLRNTIIGTIVGTVIGSLVLGICSYVFPPVWLWTKAAFMASISFLSSELALPLWTVCFLSTGWLSFLGTRCFSYTRSKANPPVSESCASLSEGELMPKAQAQPPALNEFERKVIAILASEDGGRLTSNPIASRGSTGNLRVEQALDSLMGKGLVDRSRNYVYGDFYFLSSDGRDLAIQLKFA